ncbi:hypothetical protein BD626DRAFT_115103 [Schizophyllum amplum]|uniref:Uncharacterized protein n=1 Tax=Schizophyllum amplum TaxID=97359 RepID=A0A550CUA4_9AGAR|nr:hypothetical protein BD626DRAFT_115103 [Auriculariopsis ampla]
MAFALGMPTYSLESSPSRGWAMRLVSKYSVLFRYGSPGFGRRCSPCRANGHHELLTLVCDELDPNAGHGVERPVWSSYGAENVLGGYTMAVVLQLKVDNIAAIPDDYRQEQVNFALDRIKAFHN